MTKDMFLKELEKRLSLFNETERTKILAKYKSKLTRLIRNGKGEEQAVSSLGEMDVIIKEIYEEYHLEYKEEMFATRFFPSWLEEFFKTINQVVEKMGKEGFKYIFKVLLEVFIIIFIICLLKIPFNLLNDLGLTFFSLFMDPVSHVLQTVWNIIFEVLYILLALYLFISIFKVRIKKYLE